MAYNAELQMLREFFLLYAPRELCHFCHRPLAVAREGVTFGHRRHTKVWELNFAVHHFDENRDNNTDTNLKGSHSTCHKRAHASKSKPRGPYEEEKGEGQEEKGEVDVKSRVS